MSEARGKEDKVAKEAIEETELDGRFLVGELLISRERRGYRRARREAGF